MVPTDEGVVGALGTDDALSADLMDSLRDTVRSGSAFRSHNVAVEPWAWAPRPRARDPRFPDRS